MRLRSSFRKYKNMYLGALVIILIFVIIFSVAFNFFLSRYYYNPDSYYDTYHGDRVSEIFVNKEAFAELHFPGYITRYAKVRSEGFGRYQITINENNVFTNEELTYSNKIVRGKRVGFDEEDKNYLNFKSGKSLIEEDNGLVLTSTQDNKKTQVNELRNIPNDSMVSAYFEFEKELTLNELEEEYKRFSSLLFYYAAVRVDGGISDKNTIGFNPSGKDLCIEKGMDDIYPYLEISIYKDELELNPAKVWDQHFKSLLKYMASKSEFLKVIVDKSDINSKFYENILSYVNANGVNVYGVIVKGSVEDILDFEKQKNIKNIKVVGLIRGEENEN